ncbi:MAG: hypothetical protein J6A29_05220 [Clostridia bacterium]|nr:hypothetical protein [Clostridia bacterium]
MELKTKYQYSYFIHPYVIDESKYSNYLLRLLKDKHCKLKIFEKEKDLNIYTYFLPSIKDFMFWTFNMDSKKQRAYEDLNDKMKANLLSKYPCTIFEYNLGEDVQGKIGEKNGIFFEVSKMEIICFCTGICFILFKTNLEETNNFSNLLNFNYKFRDINSEFISLKDYENIRLQTNSFKDIKDLSKIIKNITGPNKTAKELNIEDERFLTYSYVCVEQEHWNEVNEFSNVEDEFIKFMNILPNSETSNFDKENISQNTVNLGKYAKLGVTKQGTVLFTSSVNMQNYTKLLFSFETEYLYTYILAIYKKLYLKKLGKEFAKNRYIGSVKDEFVNFTQSVWIQETTNNIDGTNIYNKYRDVLDLEYIYNDIKTKYDIYYKDLNINKNIKINYVIVMVLLAILVFNVIGWITFLYKS